ncbi:cytochrome P450 4C1-like isoform X1 [Vespula squamosa]|uniref:Cytochrome P450 4C1-like isoform X1 n=1 Tax=Vespula squamosa TaxID=30214 RepID=A0ABD2BH79_VESSQ
MLNIYKISIQFLLDIAVQRTLKLWLHLDIIFYNTDMGRKFRTCLSYQDNIIGNKESMLRNHISLFMFQEQKPSYFLDFLFELSHKGENIHSKIFGMKSIRSFLLEAILQLLQLPLYF